MNDKESLLGSVAKRHAHSLEDAATDALTFILSRRASARNALSEFLKDDAGHPLPVMNVESWAATEHGAIPDLACRDERGEVVAFIESKFWATLTHHQPVTYWRALSADTPAVLLFLAPHSRIESGSLWDELVDRLRKADVELGDENRTDGLVTAAAKDGRRLALTSWDVLLDHMAETAGNDGDSQVGFEIAQLKGLAAAAVKGDKTIPDENLRQSFADAVKRLKWSGWANTDGLIVGTGSTYYARYFRLAGAPAGLRIDYEDEKQRPDRSLWLWFWREQNAKLTVDEVAHLLNQAGESELEWRGPEVFLPMVMPAGTDGQATVDTIVAELERIARILDPDGPTRDSWTINDRQPNERFPRPGEQTGGGAPIKVVSWNIGTMIEPWRELVAMDADVALLQEARRPPADLVAPRDAALQPGKNAGLPDIGPKDSWDSHSWNSEWWRRRGWNALFERWPMVVRLSDRVDVEWFTQVSPDGWPEQDAISVSGIGTITAARITAKDGSVEPFIAVSMYGRWLRPHPTVGPTWLYADASVHRIISDISAFIGSDNPETHRILAAGDINVTYGYGHGDGPYWDARYLNLFERMRIIGLEFMGPQLPNGRQATTLATGEPKDSKNVVTYYLPGKNPETASNNQLDYAFASRGFHEGVTVRAMNGVDEWGSSDHCRLFIEVSK